MAKSARASRIKGNKSKLAATVFRPVEDARVARLSEKILAVASSSKEPIRVPGEMEVDDEGREPEKPEISEKKEGTMEKTTGLYKKKIAASRVHRRGHQSRYAVVFPGVKKSSAKKGGVRKGVGRKSKR